MTLNRLSIMLMQAKKNAADAEDARRKAEEWVKMSKENVASIEKKIEEATAEEEK